MNLLLFYCVCFVQMQLLTQVPDYIYIVKAKLIHTTLVVAHISFKTLVLTVYYKVAVLLILPFVIKKIILTNAIPYRVVERKGRM